MKWNDADDDAVRATYPDYPAMCAALPERTFYSLKARAGKLGLKTPRHQWTTPELARLKILWTGHRPTKLEMSTAFPGLTLNQIRSRAFSAGFGKTGPHRMKTGVPFWDAVYFEAGRRRLTGPEIDRIAGTGTKFKIATALSDNHFIQAAEAMGGTVTIVWDD